MSAMTLLWISVALVWHSFALIPISFGCGLMFDSYNEFIERVLGLALLSLGIFLVVVFWTKVVP